VFTVGVLAAGCVEVTKFEGKVFSIGPFGFRVGFAFQQERALNLVYALHHTVTIKRNSAIMIAGGGLAGLTAKMALHGLGYGNVTLYEAREGSLRAQQQALHRLLHPSYNSWPMVPSFSATSALPFLNWHSGSAADVVKFINERWEEVYKRKLPVVRHGSVTKLDPVRGRQKKVERVRATIEVNGLKENKEFDYVILATGFGSERDLDHSMVDGYWDPDTIGIVAADEKDTRRVYVSGIGDGGLMDFVRFGFEDGALSDIAIETISRLRNSIYDGPRTSLDQSYVPSSIEDEIRELETHASALLPLSAEGQTKFGTRTENKIARVLRDGYLKILEDYLPSEAADFLNRRLRKTLVSSNRLHLVGKLEAPFTCATAPINKLLAAYLLSKNPKMYVRGKIDTGSRKLVRKDGSEEPLEDSFLVLRHGGRPPAYKISKSFAKQNRNLNLALANLTSVERSNEEICGNLQDVVSVDPWSQKFRDYRGELAKMFALSINVPISERVGVSAEDEPFWFEFNPGKISKDGTKTIVGKLGGFPHEIFGIKLLAVYPGLARSTVKRGAA